MPTSGVLIFIGLPLPPLIQLEALRVIVPLKLTDNWLLVLKKLDAKMADTKTEHRKMIKILPLFSGFCTSFSAPSSQLDCFSSVFVHFTCYGNGTTTLG